MTHLEREALENRRIREIRREYLEGQGFTRLAPMVYHSGGGAAPYTMATVLPDGSLFLATEKGDGWSTFHLDVEDMKNAIA